MRHHARPIPRLRGALARAIAMLALAAALAACGTTPTSLQDVGSVTRASTVSTTGVAITDVLPGPVTHARMNDAGVIAYVTGDTAYVYDTATKTLTDLATVVPCTADGPGNRAFETRKVTASGLVLFLCVDAHGVYRSYVWDAVARTPAVLLPGGRTRAFDMNDAGTVVGTAIFDFQSVNARQRGFVWHMGDVALTEILPATSSGFGITGAYSVNESGQVLGTTAVDTTPTVLYFLREPGGAMTLVSGIEPGGGAGDREQALINDRGDMVGSDFRRFASPQERRVFHRAADGTISDLGVGEIRGFNEASTVLVARPAETGIVSWDASTQAFTAVDVPGGRYTSAEGINEAGQVLLTTILDGDVRALVWDPETLDLTELGVPADVTPATRAEARALNDAGQVVGQYLNHPTFFGLVWQLHQDPDDPPPATDPPTAVAGGPYAVIAGNAVTLDGTASSDPAGSALTYEWDLDHDGVAFVPSATGATALLSTTADDAGRLFTVALRVTNAGGASDVATASVSVRSVEQALSDLRSEIRQLRRERVLSTGEMTSLVRMLENARRSLEGGQVSAACSQLDDYLERLDDVIDRGTLDDASADHLRDEAVAIATAIGCGQEGEL